jgi:ABC-type molybdate transport system ATPase subunit
LLAQPDNALPLAEGSGIVVRATVCGHDAARGLTTVAFEQGQLQLPDTVARQPGEAVRVRLQGAAGSHAGFRRKMPVARTGAA